MSNVETPFSNREVMLDEAVAFKPRKKFNLIVGGSAALIAVLVILLVYNITSDSYRTLENLNVRELQDNHESLYGGEYKLVGIVDADLGNQPGKGKLVAFRDKESGEIVPVLLSGGESFGVNIAKGQTYVMAVKVQQGGILWSDNIEKL